MRNAVTYWLRHWAQAVWLVGILGTATGVATSVIAVANAALWRPLPVKQPDELVRILANSRDPEGRIFPTEYELWHQRQDALADIASYQFDFPLDLDLGSRVERLNAVHVTTNMFDVLGAAPIMGRGFVSGDASPGARPAAILSERVWRTLLNADPAIIGDVIRIGVSGETQPVTVIGIAPGNLDIQSFFLDGVDVYRPISDGMPAKSFGPGRGSQRYVIGRLRSTVSVRLAEARTGALARSVAEEVPTRERTSGAHFESLHVSLFGGGRQFVALMGVAAVFVVVVACANGVSVVLALASRRSRERAIRLALGATRATLVRQAIREASLIAVGAGILALLVSRWLAGTIVALAPPGLRRLSTVNVGWLESLAAAGIILVVVLVLAAAASLVGGAGLSGTVLHEGAASTMGRSTLRARRLLLSSQQAVVLALLASAGLMIGTLWNLARQPLGFVPKGVWLADFSVPRGYTEDQFRYQALIDRIRENVQGVAGQRSVTVAFDAPLKTRFGYSRVALRNGQSLAVVGNTVMDGYFDVLGIPFVTGRDFHRADAPDRVVIVNRTFAMKYLGGVAPALGQVIQVGGASNCEVIGVVGDVREQDVASPVDPAVYQMLGGDMKFSSLLVVLRTDYDTSGTSEALAGAVRRADPQMYVKVTRLADRLREQTAAARLQATLLGLLGGFSLLIASLGVFALVAQFAADRHRELGVRSALGAGRGSLIWTMIRTVAWSTLQGVAGGCVLGWSATRMLRGFLFNMSPLDGPTWLAAIFFVVGAAFTAAWVPVHRASNVDPAIVLRHE